MTICHIVKAGERWELWHDGRFITDSLDRTELERIADDNGWTYLPEWMVEP